MIRKTILVAGGSGFLGAHLCRALLQDDCFVVCVDNLSSGTRENISDFAANDNFRFIEHDVVSPLEIECDEIYNLACPASPSAYYADAIHTLQTCFTGSYNLLRLAKENNARILFTSTSEVYGDPTVSPQSESYRGAVDTFCRRSCYDEGKRVAETLHNEFRVRYGLEVRVARLFNSYGPGMKRNDGRVVSNFIVQTLSGKPMTIYGDGRQTRSLCYCEDTIKGIRALMASSVVEPVNIGNPEELTVLEIGERIARICGVEPIFSYESRPEGDPRMRKPDISRAQNTLNWSPSVKLEDGLKRTVDWMRTQLR